MTSFFTPTDLRVVDPRATAGPSESDESVVRDLLTARLSGDDLTRALQALGLDDYERAHNPKARDAWTRTVTVRTPRDSTHCIRGHLRSTYSRRTKTGQWRCRECERLQKRQS